MNRVGRVAIICATTILFLNVLYDFAAAKSALVYGAGTVSCAEWRNFRATDDRQSSYQLQAWVDGYLSGYNGGSEGPDFLTPRPAAVAYYAWIDNYCVSNPLDPLLKAVMELRKELSLRMQQK